MSHQTQNSILKFMVSLSLALSLLLILAGSIAMLTPPVAQAAPSLSPGFEPLPRSALANKAASLPPAKPMVAPLSCPGLVGDVNALTSAIRAANTSAGPDTIELAAGCVYTLTTVDNYWWGPNGLPEITSTITISGNGSSIVRDGGAPNFRFFYVSGGSPFPATGNLTLQDLTLKGGLAQGGTGFRSGGGGLGAGGAIFNQGNVTLENSTLTANQAKGGNGGSGLNGGGGGGIGGIGGTNARPGGGGFGGNGGQGGSGGGGGGGGLGPGSGGNLNANGNSVGGGGGAVTGLGDANAGDGGASSGGGGASGIGSPGGNGVGPTGGNGGFGGGGGGATGTAGIAGIGGGNGGGGGGGGGGAGFGGAIFNMTGTLVITNSTLSGNTAQGGGAGAGLGQGYGGAIFNRNGTVTLNNTTVSSNTVQDGGGANGDGGGIYNLGDGAAATLNMYNSIVANSVSAATADCLGSTINLGTSTENGNDNLIENNSCGVTTVSTADPNLAALADNGGNSFTHKLLTLSPAINADTNSDCAATDQRGVSRSGTCDIGAYEVLLPDLSLTKSVTPSMALPGDTITYTLTFSNAVGADTATGVVITDVIPVSVTNVSVVSSGVTITQTASSYVWNVQDLAPGDEGIITITADISSPLAVGTFTNTAEITTTSVDSDTTNNSDSAGVTVQQVLTFTVNSTGDGSDNNPGDGSCDTGDTVNSEPECTLRAAIEESNADTIVTQTVAFSIAGGGVQTIVPASALPSVTHPIVIDALTQPGASCSSWP
ncbi:MAG: DUF11 domain-containing protein, partial [Chloroflexi bacterium]|nr:DUF11 domain-containing protein [Chloroflexota bacterium]